MKAGRWRPWRVLRGRPHIRLEWAPLHPSRGRIIDHGNGLRTIVLDPGLDRITRNAVLAHELVHDEYDLIWPPGTPPGIIEKGEHFVRAITAERLVPDHELLPFVDKRQSVGMVVARDVADEFEVPIEVADLALRRLVAGF